MPYCVRGHLFHVPLRHKPLQVKLVGVCIADSTVRGDGDNTVRELLSIYH